jgi:hypothetical protein
MPFDRYRFKRSLLKDFPEAIFELCGVDGVHR